MPGDEAVHGGRQAVPGRSAEKDDAVAVVGGLEGPQRLDLRRQEAERVEGPEHLPGPIDFDPRDLPGGGARRGQGQLHLAPGSVHAERAGLPAPPVLDLEVGDALEIVDQPDGGLGADRRTLVADAVDRLHQLGPARIHLELHAAGAGGGGLPDDVLGEQMGFVEGIVLERDGAVVTRRVDELQHGRPGGPGLAADRELGREPLPGEPELLRLGGLLVPHLPVGQDRRRQDHHAHGPARPEGRDEQHGRHRGESGRQMHPVPHLVVEVEEPGVLVKLRRDEPGPRHEGHEHQHHLPPADENGTGCRGQEQITVHRNREPSRRCP